jgi:plasmid stability protein
MMHNACMPVSVSIRNVPEAVRDALSARAAQRGQSLQEYLLSTLVEHVRRPNMAELMAQIRARKAATDSRVSLADILAAKDEDRR